LHHVVTKNEPRASLWKFNIVHFTIFCLQYYKKLFMCFSLSSWPLSTQEMCPFRFQFNHDNGLAGWLT
jgi:hypothetical protein